MNRTIEGSYLILNLQYWSVIHPIQTFTNAHPSHSYSVFLWLSQVNGVMMTKLRQVLRFFSYYCLGEISSNSKGVEMAVAKRVIQKELLVGVGLVFFET